MTKREAMQLFQDRKVRAVWDDEKEEWFFSVVDVVGVLTDSENPRKYWSVLKTRLKKEGSQTATNCSQLKLRAEDGRMRLTDVGTMDQILRVIQSIPSPKAEPFKQWMADVAATRLDQMQDPELSIEQAVADYKRLGYSDQWINQRVKSIEVRKELTDEWKRRGMKEGIQFAALTDIITKEWSGRTTKQYKHLKGLKKESLRDNMTNVEIAKTAKDGGSVAKAARQQLESNSAIQSSPLLKRATISCLMRKRKNNSTAPGSPLGAVS